MSDTVIEVENLSKRYRIGSARGRADYGSLRESIVEIAAAPIRRLQSWASRTSAPEPNEIWALKDVSFQVKSGETLGIIGRNGAGKSTLLKILSRITKPTLGRVTLRGRIGSLLEVGTGFHPELTGRENIYLNGAILGMTRREIERKFDEIVDFAEIEQFLETPVKFYSSGMYMRLAFAVAAHLEPEILLVDEVLAVGDVAFQKKCLGKMGEVAKEGRTVLFVSHNMAAILMLCNLSILLTNGRVTSFGKSFDVMNLYLRDQKNEIGEVDFSKRISPAKLMISKVKLRDNSGRISTQISLKEGVNVEIKLRVFQYIRNPQIVFELWSENGFCILSSTNWDMGGHIERELFPGNYIFSCHIPSEYLRSGRYWLELSSSIPNIEILDKITNAISFLVIDTGSIDANLGQGRNGAIAPILKWEEISDNSDSEV